MYKGIFFAIYGYLMINDAVKLSLLPKAADWPVNVLTFMCVIYYATHSVVKNFTNKEYRFSFFLWCDIASMIFIIGSAVVSDISNWITLSFLKIVMVVKVTDIIMEFKAWNRKRKLVKKLKLEA